MRRGQEEPSSLRVHCQMPRVRQRPTGSGNSLLTFCNLHKFLGLRQQQPNFLVSLRTVPPTLLVQEARRIYWLRVAVVRQDPLGVLGRLQGIGHMH